jgi:transposase-like protein
LEWNRRDLSSKRYAYIWADGIYFNVRLSEERPCFLVLLGATVEGKKEFLAIHDGIRLRGLKDAAQDRLRSRWCINLGSLPRSIGES